MRALAERNYTTSWGDDARSLHGFFRAQARRESQILRGKLAARLSPGHPSGPPIFLVGCPRSGTTLLFDLLRQHPDLVSLPHEGHVYWTAYNHPRRHGWRSDALEAEDASPAERRYLNTAFSRVGHGRLLDKTPKNVLRLPYLRSLFPDAQIVLIVRDGRATTASLLQGWRHRHGASYFLPEPLRLTDYNGRLWRYVLPPGWRELQGTELAQVAARQYVACNSAAVQHQALVDVVIKYEDIVAQPVEALRKLTSQLQLPQSEVVLQAAEQSPKNLRGAITAPRQDKWREVAEDLAPYLSEIEEQMRVWGYARG